MPGLETPDKVIGERTYRTVGLGGETGTHVFCRIFRQVPQVFKVRSGDALREVIANSIADLMMRPDDLVYCARAFGKSTTWLIVSPDFPERGAKSVPLESIEEAFRGRFSEYTQFLEWQTEVNFGDFLADLLARFFRAEAPPSSSPEKSPSSGPAGDSSSASA